MQNREDNFICVKCQHFRILEGGCDAFPSGIPENVLFANKHSKPIPEQKNDIVFKKGKYLELIRIENKQ